MPTDDQARADIVALRADLTKLQVTVQQLVNASQGTVPVHDGQSLVVQSGGDFQAALTTAKGLLSTGPVEIRLAAGATFTGNFIVGNTTPNALVIRGVVDPIPSSLPWITPDKSSNMPKLLSKTNLPSLMCEDGARNIRIFGLEALPNTTFPDRDLWVFGQDAMTSFAQIPSTIEIDSCYFHGDPVKGQHRGLLFNVQNGRVLRSYFEKFIEVGRDSQAFAVWNGPGPFLLDSCYFEATGENVLFGGADPKISGLVPSDITIRNCKFSKPLAWKTQFKGSVKNLFELKNAKRVLVDGCLFENSWVDAQSGYGVVITVRDQDGTAPWSTVSDVLFQYCVVRNTEGAAFQTLGIEDRPGIASVQGVRLTLSHVRCEKTPSGVLVNNGFQPTIISHCTMTDIQNWFLQFTGNQAPGFVFRDNVVVTGQYGIVGDGTGIGQPSLDAKAPGSVFTNNVIGQANSYTITFPPGNFIGAASAVNTIQGTGSDGKPPGADAQTIASKMPWL